MIQENTQLQEELNNLHSLINKFSKFQSRFDEIHKSENIETAFELLARIFQDVLGFSAVRCLDYVPVDGAYAERFFVASSKFDFENVQDDADLIQWSVENNSVMLVPVEEEKIIEQGLNSMVIMPIKGEEGYGIFLMWGQFTEKTASKFITDLLNNTAREFASVADTKLLLEKVQSVRDLMDNIVESVPQGIFAIDKDDRVVACNRDVEILFGARRVELLDQRYQDAFSKEVVSFLSELVIRALNGEQSLDHELKLYPEGPSGPELLVGISTSLLYDRQAKPHGLVFICRDLSLGLEVQRLREIDLMKNEFVHTVSHELKTPLTAIMGGAELLVTLMDEMSEECQDVVKIIEEGGKRLHTLILDLLDLSKLESGRVTIDQQVCDLSALALETVNLLKSRNQKIVWNLDQVEPNCKAYADPLKVKQVFDNLIGNAVKYSPDGGEIEVSMKSQGPRHIFAVKDQGIGIAKDQVPLVWDKFYRVDSSTTSEIEGTGLGLPIVKHIIEMHGGEVSLVSEINVGSEFGFWIPSSHDV